MPLTDRHSVPIFVDLDGTLVKTDIAQELFLQSCKRISSVHQIVLLAFSGRSYIKRFLAENNTFNESLLPYNNEVIEYLEQEKAAGRRIILATASDRIIANKVAAYVGLFDEVIASKPGNNIKGKNKLNAIKAASPNGEFEYIGDSKADYPIWEQAMFSGFVNPPKPAKNIVHDRDKISFEVNNGARELKTIVDGMRLHQWAKNVLVFLPLIFSHSYTDIYLSVHALITFFVFSFCASGIYLINDLLDIEADRAHATKKKRPFAAGLLKPSKGLIASAVLIGLSLLASLVLLDVAVTIVVLMYILLTNLYSFYLKNFSTIDVITLTCLYSIRIIAGGVAIGAALSPWLLNFSLFFFLSLAYMKRYIELSKNKRHGGFTSRNYDVDDMDIIQTIGIVNGGLAILTLTLYLNSSFVSSSYASPKLLWLIAPMLMFWIYRAWTWAKRDRIEDDPVLFALKDKISIITVAIIGATVILAKYIHTGSLSL